MATVHGVEKSDMIERQHACWEPHPHVGPGLHTVTATLMDVKSSNPAPSSLAVAEVCSSGL